MDTWIAIACGLGAAACFGTGDFLAQRLTHRHGWMPAMFAVQVVSVCVLAAVAAVWHGVPTPTLERTTQLLEVLGIGVINTLGMIGLYRAFESGKLSLVSPIAGSMGAFTVAFAWLRGDSPPLAVVPGLVAVVLGIIAASVVDHRQELELDEPAPRTIGWALGVGWALVSAIGFGWVFCVLGPTSVALGPAWTIAILRVVAIVALLALARPLRSRLDAALRETGDPPAQAPSRGRTLAVACLDSAGMVVFAYGSSRGQVSGEIAIVAVLTSSFPLVTIALARVWLRERLRWWQWIGVAVVIAGVAWVSGAL